VHVVGLGGGEVKPGRRLAGDKGTPCHSDRDTGTPCHSDRDTGTPWHSDRDKGTPWHSDRDRGRQATGW